MTQDELRAWLRLSLTDGVGNDAARRLLAAFGSPQAVFAQSEAALCQVVTAKQALALLTDPNELAVQCVRTQQWLAHQPDTHRHAVWTLGDAHYPDALLQLPDPPLMVYAQGQLEATLGPAVAIVGSRNPTPQGAQTAAQFGEALAAAGLCVVSGLALGVDGAAHLGALRGARSRETADHWHTVAVVGTGLDRVYPRQHQTLAYDIAQHGLMLSEYHLGTAPLPANFPKRNRLIAALGLGTLVVEAALQSGSLITARLALDLGREVLAIPGSIHATQSHGCHALIRQGAKLVEKAQDVLEELQLQEQTLLFDESPHDDATTEPTLLGHMGYGPVSLDALQARCGIATASLQAQLLTLELDGLIGRLPGGLFQRLGQA
ncbi:DNA-processing protein DprA [Limnohabitans sp.]|uniref:DNA-processing protein DprA n=1 Tax=Limnohabitans sp. TaxID=1907725 RepID=UPI00286FA282|nr:DNA-processing protein DprA [Limnohabitans sp.]